eukprot:1905381-Pyramimonas_sp.AAC.1
MAASPALIYNSGLAQAFLAAKMCCSDMWQVESFTKYEAPLEGRWFPERSNSIAVDLSGEARGISLPRSPLTQF